MRFLVAGAAGFIGSHLCERLLAEGHEVIGLDNLLTGRMENLAGLMDNPAFTFIRHDVAHPLGPDVLPAGARLDWVLHLASPASPKDFPRYPIEILRAGAWGTYHLLELARRHGARFLLASTSEVYGDPEVHPQPEAYWGHVNPVGPRSCYDEAKRYAEALTMAYRRKHGLDVRIARIFNTYGPRMRPDDGRVLPNFLSQALKGEPLTVYGDGTQTRSFCYVEDLVEGLWRLILWEPSAEGDGDPLSRVFNLGSPEEIRIIDLAREVIDLTGSTSTIVFKPLPRDDPKVRRPDISKAREQLGWEPRVPRREGIERTIPYFRGLIGGG